MIVEILRSYFNVHRISHRPHMDGWEASTVHKSTVCHTWMVSLAKNENGIPTEGGTEFVLVSGNGKCMSAFAALSCLLLAGSSTMLAKEYNASATSSSSLVITLRITCFRDLSEPPSFCRNNQKRPLFKISKNEKGKYANTLTDKPWVLLISLSH